MVALTGANWPSEWHADLSATYYVTQDLGNLNLKVEDYNGTDNVQVGNDQGLKITKIGSTHLSSPNSSFVLHKVLFVSEIQKNLLFVHKFCFDNNVYFEF